MIGRKLFIGCLAGVSFLTLNNVSAQVCGTTVYDTGGPGGDYANGENYTVTYCPTNPGDVVTITFTAFNTEAGWDELSVHNGPSNASTELGLFSGTTLPGTFTSTDPTGCLTIWFTSDFISNTASGWVANITCSTPPPPPPSCGTTVYDSGGAGANYANNQNYSTTYCPTIPGQAVTLNFTAFNTEAGFDYVTIHNGPTAGSPVVGSFSGNCNPGSFTSTDPSGCITLQFTSDFITTGAGWAANITCAVPPPPPAGGCFLTLRLFDSNGNGWGASSVGISINGGAVQNYGVACSFNQVSIPVSTGDIVAVSYNNSGPGQGQNSYILGLQGSSNPLFNSGTPPAAGTVFVYTATCQPPPSPPEDCFGSITICNNQSFNNTTNNTGNVADLTLTSAGCLGALERQGTWYNFSPSASGTIAFNINPANPLDDYDFAIWGPFPPGSTPNSICPPLGAPLRCSFAAPPGQTGLNYTATDVSEDPLGDKWVQYMNVTVGQVYLLYISNYSQSGLAFSLGWNLGGGASLDCTILSMDLLGLHAEPNASSVDLTWTAVNEGQTDHYLVEHSVDGVEYRTLGRLNSAGSTATSTDYRFVDGQPVTGVNYYRLQQVDAAGHASASAPVAVLFGSHSTAPVLVPNPVVGSTVIYLDWTLESACTIVITDAGGREVHRSSRALSTGPQQLVLPMADLDHGAYLLRLLAADGSQQGQARFVKLR
ncbi:MAG: CUB domain-containing protein [Flavobacteriales bacterium]